MLEETGVWASYRRGWQVLRDNLGEVVLIAVLALAIGVGLFIVLLFPRSSWRYAACSGRFCC